MLLANVRLQDFFNKKKDYIQTQVGNPEGLDKPNKKVGNIHNANEYHWWSATQYYDPRVWIREGEKTLTARVKEACADLGNVGHL